MDARLALVSTSVTISPSPCAAAIWTPLYASDARVMVNVVPTVLVTVMTSGLVPVEVQIRQRKFGAGGVAPDTMTSVVSMSEIPPSSVHWMPFS